MYNLMLVDDEPEILEYVENLINWNEYGFNLLATASTATSALKKAQNNVDLLITDITMPGMSGLDLIRLMKTTKPQLKSIVLTCHENFDFATEAIRLGVYRYYVKYLLDSTQLAQALIEIRQQLDEQNKNETLIESATSLQNNTKLSEKFLDDLLCSDSNRKYFLKSQLENLPLLKFQNSRTVLVSICDWDLNKHHLPIPEMDLLLYALQNIISEIVPNKLFSAPYLCGRDKIAIFLNELNQNDIMLKEMFMNLCEKAHKHLGVQLTICLTAQPSDILNFKETIDTLTNLQSQNFYNKKNSVIFEKSKLETPVISTIDLYALNNAIESQNYDQIILTNDEYLDFFEKNHSTKEQVDLYYNRLISEFEHKLSSLAIDGNYTALTIDSWECYKHATKLVIDWFFEILANENQPKMRSEIQTVVAYIHNNLDKKITCASMAEKENMNVNYFSKLFKTQTGVSFSEYLIKKRVERATYLLQNSSYSIDQITELVGLENMHYFYRMYKKETGVSPGSLRRVSK